jgi:hypothetical protein
LKYLKPILLSLALTACGSDDSGGPGAFSVPILAKAGHAKGGPDRVAVELARNGYCEDAVPILQCYVYRGRGNEMAQSTLGKCMIQEASVGDKEWQEGVTWLRRAGDTGLPEAQSQLVQTLAQSNNPGDIVEAQTWRIIYERGKSSPFPPPPLPSSVVAQLNARLSPAMRSEADDRARMWSYRFWVMQPSDAPDAKAAMEACKGSRAAQPRVRRSRDFDPTGPVERRGG